MSNEENHYNFFSSSTNFMIDNKEAFLYHKAKTKSDVNGAESEYVWGTTSKIPQGLSVHLRTGPKGLDEVDNYEQ